MESGLVSELKHRQQRMTQLKTWIFASSNDAGKLLAPLLTRFTVIHLKPYTKEEIVEIADSVLNKDENIENLKNIEFDIDKTVPQASIDVNPKTIWSPNNKMVNVTITGSSSDDHLSKTTITVSDEYHLIEPIISGFGQTIQLEARRNGSDSDGRVYIIKVGVEDLAGNKKEAQVQVIVPHDQDR